MIVLPGKTYQADAQICCQVKPASHECVFYDDISEVSPGRSGCVIG
jgi:hypothetical protein